MNFVPAGFAKKAKAAACLPCASFLFAALSAGEQAAPIRIQEAQIRKQYGFSRTAAPSYRLIAVLKDGGLSRYSTEKDSWGGQTICIGAQDGTLKEGAHVFRIIYMTDSGRQ